MHHFERQIFTAPYFKNIGTHAREWISPAVGLWVLTELVTNANYKYLLDAFDVYIVPNVNPDGYEYAHTSVSFS